MLLQQQQHAHGQGGCALPPDIPLVLGTLERVQNKSHIYL